MCLNCGNFSFESFHTSKIQEKQILFPRSGLVQAALSPVGTYELLCLSKGPFVIPTLPRVVSRPDWGKMENSIFLRVTFTVPSLCHILPEAQSGCVLGWVHLALVPTNSMGFRAEGRSSSEATS